MTTIHDVLRFLVRGGPNNEANVRQLLETIDSHQLGYPDLESYHDAQAKEARAAANQPAAAGEAETDLQRANRLEAENTQLQARLRAGTTSSPTPPPSTL